MNITNTLLFFVEKDSHIFSTKNKGVFAFEVDTLLTKSGPNDSVMLTKF